MKFNVGITIDAESKEQAKELLKGIQNILKVVPADEFIEVAELIKEKPVIVEIINDIASEENFSVAKASRMLPKIIKKLKDESKEKSV